MCSVSIFEARNNLSEYIKIAESGEPVQLTRYNKPVAVIINYAEYQKSDPEPSWLEKWRKDNAKFLDDEGIPLPPRECLNPERVIFED